LRSFTITDQQHCPKFKDRKTKAIGIIPEIVHHFFSTVINGIEQVANENGYSVIICLSDDSFDKEVLNMEMLANGSIDGFIMSLSKKLNLKVIFIIFQKLLIRVCLSSCLTE
jgi:DNA-binding LacI/PurR family transcriptional regulator